MRRRAPHRRGCRRQVHEGARRATDAGQRRRHRARPARDDGQGARGSRSRAASSRRRWTTTPRSACPRRSPPRAAPEQCRAPSLNHPPRVRGRRRLRASASRSSVPARTLLQLIGFVALVALAILSLGTLISILLAAVLALGLDPVVGALVGAAGIAGGPRCSSSPRCSSRCSRSCSSPPGRYGTRSSSSSTSSRLLGRADVEAGLPGLPLDGRRRRHVKPRFKELAAGLPDAASALLGVAGSVFGSVLSLVTLTFLALFLLMERPTITDWLFGFTPPEVEARWQPTLEEAIPRVLLADRQRRDLGRRRPDRRLLGVGCSACRSRSCSASSPACST